MGVGINADDLRELLPQHAVNRGTRLTLRDHDRAVADDALPAVSMHVGRATGYATLGIWAREPEVIGCECM